MWDSLKTESRPIVVYGMGNGADKLLLRLEEYGITVSDFFASDGFVRGHLFHGKRVKSFSEIKSEYEDFVILLSFASNKEDVIEMLGEIDGQYEMYVPDMPVAGASEYFDKDFYNRNYQDILKAYNSLADRQSKDAFAAVVSYKLTGKLSYLMGAYSIKDELYSLLPRESIRTYIDAGAYNGDTVKEALEYFPNIEKIYAIEPDAKNIKKLLRLEGACGRAELYPVNAAVWCECCEKVFSSAGNRNSSVSSTSSFEHKEIKVQTVTVDSLGVKADYIKYDVEGAELEALLGSFETIKAQRPALLVSLYHRSKDIFSLTNLLTEKFPFYKAYLRRLKCIPAWELDLILLPSQQ